MKHKLSLCFLSLSLVASAQVATLEYETNVTVETIAGSGFRGHVDGQGIWTMFNHPNRLAIDVQSNILVWDADNRAIRKISPDFTVTTVFTNFPYTPNQVCSCGSNFLFTGWETNTGTPTIWKISSDAQMSIFWQSSVSGIYGVTCASSNTIFFSAGARIYKLKDGVVTVFAGSGNPEMIDGVGIFSSFYIPTHLAIDTLENIYVADASRIRKITPQAVVTSIPVTVTYGASGPLCIDPHGTLYVIQQNRILALSGDRISILAGGLTSGESGFRDGEGQQARFYEPLGIAYGPDHMVYIADSNNQRIRRITFNPVPAAQLNIDMRPCLSITGQLGRQYRIESRNRITDPWLACDTITLSNNPTVWVDQRMAFRQQYYRAVLSP